MSPKMPKEYADLRRQQILTAAWECFAEKGYEKTTIRDIAGALKLSTGTIYTYFKGKDDMLEALNAWSMEQKNTLFNEMAQKETTREAVEEFFIQAFECCSLRDLIKSNKANINLWAEAMRRENIKAIIDSQYEILQKKISDFFKKGIDRGEINPEFEPEILANYFLTFLLGLQLHITLLDEANGESFLKDIKKLMLANIWRDDSNVSGKEAGEHYS